MIGLSPRGLLAATAYAAAVIGAGAAASIQARQGRGPQPYERFRQAPFAPPAAAFGPVWTVNKVADTWSLARLAHLDPPDEAARRARRTAFAAAAVNEITYVAFPLAYFRLRSPWLAAAVTATSAVATIVQLDATRRIDAAAVVALLPQTAWLALATPVAGYQAIYNADPFLGTPALRR